MKLLSSKLTLLSVSTGALLALYSVPALASHLDDIDLASLSSTQGFAIKGAAAIDQFGYSVSSAGDINHDGIQDLIIGAYYADPYGREVAGASYVIYGKAGGYNTDIDLASLSSTQGFTIKGATAGDQSGFSVSSAGDINDDGIQDFIIGAPGADPSGRSAAGASYVIYGKVGGYEAPIDLASLNSTQGFTINGAAAYDRSGHVVRPAGDINHDGIHDLIIGAYYADPSGRSAAGASYVVYGKVGGYEAPIDLASLNSTQGFTINGAAAMDQSGISVSSAGDINDDGIQDLIIGAPYVTSPNRRFNAGASYVIYGKAGGYDTALDLASLNNTQGFIIKGAVAGDQSGFSVSSAGDINHDGIQDLLIGAYYADPGRSFAGVSYVIYGKAGGYDTAIDLASLNNTQGFIIKGAAAYDRSGFSVSSAGDINDDGIHDLIIGAPYVTTPNHRSFAGASYVIYGKAGGYDTAIDLASLSSTQGFTIKGTAANDQSGFSVSSAGDINHDGIQDLIIGAPYVTSPNRRFNAGASYVIYGRSAPSPSPSASPSASASPSPSASPSVSTNLSSSVSLLVSPSYSSASAHNVPWYSPVKWFSSLKEWWYTEESIDTTLPYVNAMLKIKAQINQASQLSSDRWFQFSLEDLAEDIDLILKNPQALQKDTIKDMQKRLKGIQRDFLDEDAPQLNGLFADQVQLPPLKNPMVALNPSLASLTYQGFVPLMLTK